MSRYHIFILIILTSLCTNAFSETVSFYNQGRLFKLISPIGNNQKKPLLLLLHGCKQTADIILEGTGLKEEALRRDFFLLVPDQSTVMNNDHCWNWFYSHEQVRGSLNEMTSIISAIEVLGKSYAIDRSKIYAAGISAGGAMAHNLLACYPDYFSGVAIHSGLAFKTAENIFEAQTVLTSTAQKDPEYLGSKTYACGRISSKPRALKKILIIHGLDDKRVPSLHADLMSSTQEVLNDLLDDEIINHSDTPQAYEHTTNFANGYKAFISDKNYKSFSERKILIKGLQHAWGGGKPISVNFDPAAPSSNAFIFNYFNL
jgi:poly(hydroxyalkanoate) depolymerase family esterase